MPLRNNLWNRIGALANAARKMRANFEGNGFVTAQLDGILRDLSASEVGEGTITAALTKIIKLQAAVSGSGVLTADLGGFTGLLDDYGGAAAAYSVRRLSSTYEDSLIEVRRSSDNTTQDIGYDSNGDLDTSALLSFVGAGDGFVRTWYDQSGNANDAQQTTTSAQPQIVSSGSTITENSKPCVLFDGSTDILTASYSIGSDVTIFNVTTHTNAPTANEDAWSLCDSPSAYNRYELRADGTVFEYFIRESSGDGGSFVSETIETQDTNQNLFSSALLSSTNYAWTNGVNKINASATGLSMPNSTVIALGGLFTTTPLFFLDGNIQEFILYPSDQLTNRTAIETDINTYYSIY